MVNLKLSVNNERMLILSTDFKFNKNCRFIFSFIVFWLGLFSCRFRVFFYLQAFVHVSDFFSFCHFIILLSVHISNYQTKINIAKSLKA